MKRERKIDTRTHARARTHARTHGFRDTCIKLQTLQKSGVLLKKSTKSSEKLFFGCALGEIVNDDLESSSFVQSKNMGPWGTFMTP